MFVNNCSYYRYSSRHMLLFCQDILCLAVLSVFLDAYYLILLQFISNINIFLVVHIIHLHFYSTEFYLIHMDEFIDSLLRDERVCDIILPRIQV